MNYDCRATRNGKALGYKRTFQLFFLSADRRADTDRVNGIMMTLIILRSGDGNEVK